MHQKISHHLRTYLKGYNNMKKAIILVSFGSSMDHVVKAYIEPVEIYFTNQFTDYEVRRAFTSNFIRKKLNNRGVAIDSVEEAIEKLISEQYEEILLQPLHIIPGYEYEKIRRAYEAYEDQVSLRLSTPLLFTNEDYQNAVNALVPHLPELTENEALLFMGHGTKHQANAAYFALQHHLKAQSPHYYIANVEAIPTLDDTITTLKEAGYKKIYLMPFMLVAGDHALNDMASDEEDSWKSTLEAENFDVECILKGLGGFASIHHLFEAKTKDIETKN